jgi:integrase
MLGGMTVLEGANAALRFALELCALAALGYWGFRPLLRQAGLPEIRFHDLRHTAAILLLGQGVHPKIVSEMLGHSTINITLDLYSHVTPTMQKEAVNALDALFRP